MTLDEFEKAQSLIDNCRANNKLIGDLKNLLENLPKMEAYRGGSGSISILIGGYSFGVPFELADSMLKMMIEHFDCIQDRIVMDLDELGVKYPVGVGSGRDGPRPIGGERLLLTDKRPASIWRRMFGWRGASEAAHAHHAAICRDGGARHSRQHGVRLWF